LEKILILGITGMLGHTLFYELSQNDYFDVFGTVRNSEGIDNWFNSELLAKIIDGVEADNFDGLKKFILNLRPDVVINCIGIIKQIPLSNDPIASISVNSLFPHQIAKICQDSGARFIHISTDCVFSGQKGNYEETDISDAVDLYGRTKFLGEVGCPHCVTLRTSIIGHELRGKYGLLEWFISQKNKIKGFKNTIFSGFPTVELARIIQEYVIPNSHLNGLYHVSSNPISKYDLLNLIARRYNKNIEIEPYDGVKEDRSLNSTLFKNSTGYIPPPWEKLVDEMYQDYLSNSYYQHNLC
jgi:dTDP-4-dehydrorhamnose reductase